MEVVSRMSRGISANKVAVMASASVLAHYDITQKLKLAADASAYGLGAVISHTYIYEDGSEKPSTYAPHTLSNAEKLCSN